MTHISRANGESDGEHVYTFNSAQVGVTGFIGKKSNIRWQSMLYLLRLDCAFLTMLFGFIYIPVMYTVSKN